MKKLFLTVCSMTALFFLVACGNGDASSEVISTYLDENMDAVLATIGERPNTEIEVVAGDNDETVIVYFHLDEEMSAAVEEMGGDDVEGFLVGMLEGQETLMNITFMNLVDEIEADTLTVYTRFTVNGERAAEVAYEVEVL